MSFIFLLKQADGARVLSLFAGVLHISRSSMSPAPAHPYCRHSNQQRSVTCKVRSLALDSLVCDHPYAAMTSAMNDQRTPGPGRVSPLRPFVRVLSLTCKEATRLQSEAMDRRLSFLEKLGLRVHLLLCKWCRRYGEQLTFLRSAARERQDHVDPGMPQKLSPEARERIR